MIVSFEWINSAIIPPTEIGHSNNYIVAVKRKSSGQTYTSPACHLNRYPLEYDDGCICEREEYHDDGCPTSGWFSFEASNQYDGGLYTNLLDAGDELLAWAAIPQFNKDESK